MDKIRIGIDIQCEWSITTNGAPLALDGRDLTLVLSTPIGLKRELPFTTEGNVAHFSYHGIDHRQLGKYSVTMWENKGKIGQNAVDKVDAFVLVRSTEEMGVGKPSNLKVVTVNLGTGNFVTQMSGGSCDGNVQPQIDAMQRQINAMQRQISDLQQRIEVLEQGGVTPPSPQVTDALLLANRKPLMLCNGNYLKINKTIN